MIKQRIYSATVVLTMLLAGCSRDDGTAAGRAAPSAFADDRAAWVGQREADLRRPDGWTSLIGLHWLDGSVQTVGGGDGNAIRLAIAPAALGRLEPRGDVVYFVPAAGARLTVDGHPLRGGTALAVDGHAAGTVLGYDEGKGRITLIDRSGHLALRVHHVDAPTRLQFQGLAFWPADPAWQLRGRFVAYPAGRTQPILNRIGDTNEVASPGYVEFDKDGRRWRLEAFGDPANGLNLMFRDATSGHASYGPGRYLKTAPVAADGSVAIDFNRAYNPPCAYTAFATCPLPPRQNDLGRQAQRTGERGLSVDAGEKTYAGPHA